jgi:DNA-binding transcriptional MerR regulator
MKRCGRRYYRQSDIEIISKIRALLRDELYTIEGARRQLGKT